MIVLTISIQDLVAQRWEYDDGFAGINVTPAVESYVAASSQNCLWSNSIVLREGGTNASTSATLSRWQSDMRLAAALGYEIQLKWRQSNYSWGAVCILDRFWIWAQP